MLICFVYTILTITSSGYALMVGVATDTHFHLLARFAITAIGIGSILIFNLFPRWPLPAISAFHYGVTMSSIFMLVWISGFIIELHPDAFRDIFLNFTTVYLLVGATFLMCRLWRKKRQASRQE